MALTTGITYIIEYLITHPWIILVLFLSYCFIFAVSLWFSGPKPGPNPFRNDTRRPAEPLVLDRKARKAVIKQVFAEKKIPPRLDAIVIGSGIAGLTTASLLARSGRKVLVLEQHDRAGGCCHTFKEKGFEFDVGIHYIGEVKNNTLMKIILDQISNGQLVWTPLDAIYDTVVLGDLEKPRKYPLPSHPDEYKAMLLEKFPNEKTAIEKYFEMLKDCRKQVMGLLLAKVLPKLLFKVLYMTGLFRLVSRFFDYTRKSMQQTLDELTSDDELKAVLLYNFGDYGVKPNEVPPAMHLTLVNHFLYGSSYPRGGASEISFHIIPTIEKAGGRVLVKAPVSEILLDSTGSAVGVRIKKADENVDVFAPCVISACGVPNTFHKLLPKEVSMKTDIYKLLQKRAVKPGQAAISLFVGLEGTSEELGLKAQNFWCFPHTDLNGIWDTYHSLTAEEAMESEVPLLFISFPSSKDPTHEERYPGKSTCTVVSLVNYDWFKEWDGERLKHRGQDYETLKNTIGRRMWEGVCKLLPHLADKVEYFEVGSPLSNNYYLGAYEGEIYGMDHDFGRFSPEAAMHLRPESGVKNLYLSGQDVFQCGFAGGLFSGVLTASKVLNRNLVNDLIAFKKANPPPRQKIQDVKTKHE